MFFCLFSLNIHAANPNIIGGQPVGTMSEAPWQGALILDGTFLGGFSIIGNRWVVTAAHNIRIPSVGFDENQPSRCQIRVGSLQWNSGGKVLNIEKIIVHESYNSQTQENDIALIRTSSDISFTPQVQPIVISDGCNTTAANFQPGMAVNW